MAILIGVSLSMKHEHFSSAFPYSSVDHRSKSLGSVSVRK